jgi:hypothetical protein
MNVLISLGIRILEILFFAGCTGSLLVVLLSLIEFTNPGTGENGSDDELNDAQQEKDQA